MSSDSSQRDEHSLSDSNLNTSDPIEPCESHSISSSNPVSSVSRLTFADPISPIIYTDSNSRITSAAPSSLVSSAEPLIASSADPSLITSFVLSSVSTSAYDTTISSESNSNVISADRALEKSCGGADQVENLNSVHECLNVNTISLNLDQDTFITSQNRSENLQRHGLTLDSKIKEGLNKTNPSQHEVLGGNYLNLNDADPADPTNANLNESYSNVNIADSHDNMTDSHYLDVSNIADRHLAHTDAASGRSSLNFSSFAIIFIYVAICYVLHLVRELFLYMFG
uniref:Uncharacterized protein n=1 Tax=Cacopsylla melanoneura TaxID=428564 RepID=A0A8D8LET5_9HEMI